jgi:hypothetical protein
VSILGLVAAVLPEVVAAIRVVALVGGDEGEDRGDVSGEGENEGWSLTLRDRRWS